jgi:2-dehydro-3-deoxyphosphogluconate aldolase/(4S)-4-hydroxy-2-oxoglutarate aldolase
VRAFATLRAVESKAAVALVEGEAIVGVVREESAAAARAVARAYVEHGLRLIEITLTTPDALTLIAELRERHEAAGVVVAAGTVRGAAAAAAARAAGARILVSPHTDRAVIDDARTHGLLAVAGALTPTEILAAWEAGAGVVKVYPASAVGGPEYLRTIRGPIRDVRMLAGGLVPLETIPAYLAAGAVAVNLGASLAVPELVRAARWDEIGARVVRAREQVRAARGEPAPSVV